MGRKEFGLSTQRTSDQPLTVVSRGRHLSYQRSRHNTHPKTSLIKIEGVDDTPAAKYVCPLLLVPICICAQLLTNPPASTWARRWRSSTRATRRSGEPRSG